MAYRLLAQTIPTLTIAQTAAQRGISPQQMVKSILLRDMDHQYALACIPGDRSVDPSKVRSLLHCRRMTCAKPQDVLSITGYALGCVAPLLLKHPIPIIMDSGIAELEEVTISSGQPMAGIALRSSDLLTLCQPTLAKVCRN